MTLHLRATGCHLPYIIRHKWTHPALAHPEAGTRFTYPGGMEGWVGLGDQLHTEMVYPPAESVTHPNTNPAVHGPESYSRSVDHKSDALTTTHPSPINLLLQ